MSMTIKEYAESRKISYEAVRKQIKEYKNKELKAHIKYDGRTANLDDYAIDFLDGHRQKRNALLYPTNKEIEEEMARLRTQILNLQEELVRRSDRYTQLLEEHSKLLEDKARTDTLLLLADKEHDELEQTKHDLSDTKEELNKFKPTLFGLYKKVD